MMNSGIPFLVGNRPAEAFQRLWQQWHALLARCGSKPSRKRVHELRIATLRLQALLEFWLRGHARHPAAKAVRRWSKQADKLRHSLQSARAAEVYSRKLAWLGEQAAGGPECLRQIARLERGFVRRREAAEKRAAVEIGRRSARLEQRGKEIEKAIASPVARGAGRGAEVVREKVAGLKEEFPELSADCLHEYRKRVKSLRYLAEFLAESDARTARQAEVLGKMQAAIGEWRDWYLLERKAWRSLQGQESVVPDLLAEQERKLRRKALDCCRRATAQLLKDEMPQTNPLRRGSRKIPVRKAGMLVPESRRERA